MYSLKFNLIDRNTYSKKPLVIYIISLSILFFVFAVIVPITAAIVSKSAIPFISIVILGPMSILIASGVYWRYCSYHRKYFTVTNDFILFKEKQISVNKDGICHNYSLGEISSIQIIWSGYELRSPMGSFYDVSRGDHNYVKYNYCGREYLFEFMTPSNVKLRSLKTILKSWDDVGASYNLQVIKRPEEQKKVIFNLFDTPS